jgi:hypothetical protein
VSKCTNVRTGHTDDLSVSFVDTSGSKVAVGSAISVYKVPGTRFAVTVTFHAPTDLSEGVYVASMTWYNGTKQVAFDFTVSPPLRVSIVKLLPSSALPSGGDELVVQVSELRPVMRANQIRVAFGSDSSTVFGVVKSLLVSTTLFTSFTVLVPKSTMIGYVNVSV